MNEKESINYLKKLDNDYYNTGISELSDDEYDELKEKIIKYVQAKNKYIKNITDIDYVTKEDIDDIMCWKEEDCRLIWRKIKPINEINGCPWCIKTYIKHDFLNCTDCSYGNRNGECVDDSSRITSIRNKAYIVDILMSDEIVEAYNKINNEE